MELTFLPVNMVKEKGDKSGVVLPLCFNNSLFDFFFRCDFCYTLPLYIVAIHRLFFLYSLGLTSTGRYPRILPSPHWPGRVSQSLASSSFCSCSCPSFHCSSLMMCKFMKLWTIIQCNVKKKLQLILVNYIHVL